MKINERLNRILSKMYGKFITIIGSIGMIMGLWLVMEIWSIVLVLGLWVLLLFSVLIYQSRAMTLVHLIRDEGKVINEVTNMLIETTKEKEHSFYYYGGIGFIGDSKEWQTNYEKSLDAKSIKVVRLLDLKSLTEMNDMLKDTMPKEEVDEEIRKYDKWLKTHSKNLKYTGTYNLFYDFEGAAVWKYGVHYMIFAQKHVVILFLEGENRNAVFIRNCPQIATALVRSLDQVTHTLKLPSLSEEDMEKKIDMEIEG